MPKKEQPPSDKRGWNLAVALHAFLNGVTVSAVGLIAAIVLGVFDEHVTAVRTWLIIAMALVILAQPNIGWRIVAILLGACVYALILLD